jgi:hypothetical protein
MHASLSLDLQRFAEAFPTEDELRKRVHALLARMPHTQGVEITHGPQEYGKDLVFYSPDGFDDWVLHACVVKNEKISGSAEDKSGARNVFHQVEQALDTPFIKSSGEEVRVARVYVISPFDCPQTTMRSIQGKLLARSGQVDFLCGARLLEKFAKYWPEFIAFESTVLGAYVASLQRGFDESDPLNFLMGQHAILSGIGRSLTNVYVRQGFRITLQSVELLVRLPIFAPLDSITQETFGNMLQSLRVASMFISHTEVWDEGNEQQADLLVKELVLLVDELEETWDPTVEKRYEETLRAVDTVLRRFAQHVEMSNKFATEVDNVLSHLHSSQFQNFIRVQSVVRAFPNAFRRIGSPRTEIYPDNLLEQIEGPVLITAPAGYGKTSFCKWNTINDALQLANGTSKNVPVYVALHQLSQSPLTAPETAFFQTQEIQQLVESAKKNRQRVRLYLDGLDEITNPDQQRRVMALAEQISHHESMQIVVTSRDHLSGSWLKWLSRIRLAELNDEQIAKLIGNWLGEQAYDLQNFNEQIERSRTLKGLMRIPLLATLIIAVFKRLKSLPENRVRLYEMFVELMCGGWDFAKNITRDSRFKLKAKMAVLIRLAALLHLSVRREAREADFEMAVKVILPAEIQHWRGLLDEILEDGLLVRTGHTLAFSHLSFQEFLVAKDLNDPNASRQQTVLRSFLSGDDWWREVLSFYFAMDKRPDEMEYWVLQTWNRMPKDYKQTYDLQARYEFLLNCLKDAYVGWSPRRLQLSSA